MMTNDAEQAILSQLANANRGIEDIQQSITTMKADIAETRSDIKTMKDDINTLKVTQAKLTTDNGWIKVLFGGAVSMILILLSILITTIFKLLSMLG